jgi:alkylresorcinol/alkylpyrone synthase
VRRYVELGWSGGDLERMLPVFDHSGVRTRHFALPIEDYLEPVPFPERNARWIEAARALDAEASKRALASAGLAPSDVTHVVHATSTGISAPSLDAYLLGDLGLPTSVRRFPLWGLGCAAGATALGLAGDLVRADPGAVILVVAVELCSLTFLHGDRSKRNLVALALFGDGAAAAVVAAGKAGLALGPHRTTTWRNSLDVMGWRLRRQGLRVVFSSRIPDLARRKMGDVAAGLRRVVPAWTDGPPAFAALHPGGPKVLDALAEAMDLPEATLTPARRVLSRCGNMSSPTFLFVLEEILRHGPPPAGVGVYGALGPGFTSEIGALLPVGVPSTARSGERPSPALSSKAPCRPPPAPSASRPRSSRRTSPGSRRSSGASSRAGPTSSTST